MKLKDKIAIVTGGTRGIGRAIVEAFAQEGARVIFTYVKSDSLADEIKRGMASSGGRVEGFKVDVRDYEKVDAWKEEILEKFGRVDILVNNAGIIKDKALAMMSSKEWHDVIDTNLYGVFNVTKSFIVTFMKQKEGNIINISSLSGIIGLPRQVNYSASKGGIISFTRSLAREVASFGIRVNAIAPGFIHTDMTAELGEEHIQRILPQIPLARFGTSEEVAKVALFLTSDESNYITAQVIRVDGGLSM